MSDRKVKPERSVQLLQRPTADRPGLLLMRMKKETSVYHLWQLGHLVFLLEKLGAGLGHSYTVKLGASAVCQCPGWQLGHRVCRHVRMLEGLRKGGQL